MVLIYDSIEKHNYYVLCFSFYFRTPMQALISIPSITVTKIVRYWLVVDFSLFNYVIHDTFTL